MNGPKLVVLLSRFFSVPAYTVMCVLCILSIPQDAASPRYIFTSLQKAARAIFHPDDDALLTYLEDDGRSIEPEYYMPVLPLILVNGADGIGTGWSSQVGRMTPQRLSACCLPSAHVMSDFLRCIGCMAISSSA